VKITLVAKQPTINQPRSHRGSTLDLLGAIPILGDSNLKWAGSLWNLTPKGGGTISLKIADSEKKLKNSPQALQRTGLSRTGLSPKRV